MEGKAAWLYGEAVIVAVVDNIQIVGKVLLLPISARTKARPNSLRRAFVRSAFWASDLKCKVKVIKIVKLVKELTHLDFERITRLTMKGIRTKPIFSIILLMILPLAVYSGDIPHTGNHTIYLPFIRKPGVWTWLKAPARGVVKVTEPSPSQPTIVYAGTKAGLFKSLNGGLSWDLTNLIHPTPIGVAGISVHPDNPDNLYVAFPFDGLFHSIDGGITWRKALNGSFSDVKFHPGNPNKVYAVQQYISNQYNESYGVNLLLSDDGGNSWVTIPTHATGTARISVSVEGTIFLSAKGFFGSRFCKGLGIWRSNNGGWTWSSTNNGIIAKPDAEGHTCLNVYDFLPAWDNPGMFYSNLHTTNFIDGDLYISKDWGDSWTQIPSISIQRGLAIDPLMPDMIYAVNDNNLPVRSRDGGKSWEPITAGWTRSIRDETTLSTYAITSTTILASRSYGGIWLSQDQGDHWIDSNSGLGIAEVQGISVAPSDTKIIYATTGDAGIFKSNDGGAHWEEINQGIDIPMGYSFFTISVDSFNPNLVYIAGNGSIFRTTNGGEQWQVVTGENEWSFSFASEVDPISTGTAYISKGRNLLKTIDGGLTWSTLALPASINDIAISKSDPSFVFAATEGGVYKSADSGISWVLANTGIPDGQRVYSIAVDPIQKNILYAGLDIGSKLYKSQNSGESWALVESKGIAFSCLTPPGVVTDILVDEQATNHLFMSVGIFRGSYGVSSPDTSFCGGLFESSDGGMTWSPMPFEFQGGSFFFQRLSANFQSGDLFAGSVGLGAWKYHLVR